MPLYEYIVGAGKEKKPHISAGLFLISLLKYITRLLL